MKKHLLIFTWEYNGYHSKQGTALAKRPRHVAESFNANGWNVTVIHKDQKNECNKLPFLISNESNGIKRISVRQTKETEYSKNVLQRQLETLYYVAFRGDRSYEWATDVIHNFSNFDLAGNPDLIISFYTPRVPLFLGDYFSKKLGAPWIADLQDPIYEGISKKAQPFCRYWMKNILTSANAVIHVSPEWAEMDGKRINRKIQTIRHAVPAEVVYDNADNVTHLEINEKAFNIFYGGFISPNVQSLQVLKSVLSSLKSTNIDIQLLLAGDTIAHDYFKRELGENVVRYLGWLSKEVMLAYIRQCNCTLVIPWSKDRVGIPSKFYELCSYGKPIWIIGNDLGAFSVLLSEWKHPEILFDSIDFQRNALAAAVNNDYSAMFNIKKCDQGNIWEGDLFNKYISALH